VFLKLMCCHLDELGYGLILKNQGRKFPETGAEIYEFLDSVHKDMKSMGNNTTLCEFRGDEWVKQCLKSAEANGLKLIVGGFRDEVMDACGTHEAAQRKIRMSPPHLRIPRANAAPDLDRGWEGAGRTTLSVGSAIPPFIDEVVLREVEEKTDIFLMHDAESLYLKFVCHEPEMYRLKASGWKHWIRHTDQNDDAVRFIINPSHGDQAKHMCVNCLGTNARTWWQLARQNQRLGVECYDRDWEENWEEHVSTQTRMSARSWELFVRVPLEQLGLTPEPGTVHRVNFIREEQGKGEISLWSDLFGGAFLPRLGTCEFIESDCALAGDPLSGTVRDGDGNGLGGVAVTCGGTTVVTEADGTFVVPCYDASAKELLAYRPGYVEARAPCRSDTEICLSRDNSYEAEIERARESVRRKVELVRHSDAVIAYYPFDEPHARFAPALKGVAEMVSTYDPDREIVSSIAPNELENMGYLTKMARFSRHIITHYHLYKHTREGDFDAMENRGQGYTEYLDAAHAQVPELDLWPAMQVFSNELHPPEQSRAVDALGPPTLERVANWRFPTPDELRVLILLGLAHGMKGVFYFTYNYFDYEGETVWGLIDEQGNRNEPLIGVVRELNELIEEHSDLLLDLKRVHNLAEIEGGYAEVQTHVTPDGAIWLFAVNKDVKNGARLKISAKQTADHLEEVFSQSRLEARPSGGFLEFKDDFEKAQGKLYKLVKSHRMPNSPGEQS